MTLIKKIQNSNLFKDSIWAVLGNGIGNALLLLAGIFIARLLGKDVYGEYGLVKSTMFYIASFATFGLGLTSTRYIAQFLTIKQQYIKGIIHDVYTVTLVFSGSIALLLMILANKLANYVGEPGLSVAFRFLAGIVIFKAITTAQIGILAGFKEFKVIAKNSVLSGLLMLIICIPLTYFFGIKGSLFVLFVTQLFNAIINFISIFSITKTLEKQISRGFKIELIRFSFPVALQDSSFIISHWLAILFLTKLSSVGELGLYTAAAQWNSIILMIPTLLSNVILSYLSTNSSDKRAHNRTIGKMFAINVICTFIPFIFVIALSDIIASFYGNSFNGLSSILRIFTYCTIFESASSVFRSEFMAKGKTWLLFYVRCFRDVLLLVLTYILLTSHFGINGAYDYACANVFVSVIFLFSLYLSYKIKVQ